MGARSHHEQCAGPERRRSVALGLVLLLCLTSTALSALLARATTGRMDAAESGPRRPTLPAQIVVDGAAPGASRAEVPPVCAARHEWSHVEPQPTGEIAIRLRTVDALTGAPIPECAVQVVEFSGSAPGVGCREADLPRVDRRLPFLLSDAEGIVELRVLSPATYWIIATADGHHPALAGPLDADRDSVELCSVGLRRSIQLAGTVRTDDGRPAGGATVHARPMLTSETLERGTLRASQTRTDERGCYRLDALDEGDWMITIEHLGWPVTSTFVTIGATVDQAPLDLCLDSGTTLTGRVEREGVACRRAAVTLSSHAFGTPGSVSTDASGRFRFERVPAGPCAVAVVSEAELEGGAHPWTLELDLADGEERDVTISLPAEERVELRGEVVIDGRVSSEGVIHIEGISPAGVLRAHSRLDETGSFRFPGLRYGDYRLRVVLPGEGEAPRALAFEHSMRGREDTYLRIDVRLATLRGTLYDATTGAPRSGVALGLEREVSRCWLPVLAPADGAMTTDALGRFSTESLLPGVYRLTTLTDVGIVALAGVFEIAPEEREHFVEAELRTFERD